MGKRDFGCGHGKIQCCIPFDFQGDTAMGDGIEKYTRERGISDLYRNGDFTRSFFDNDTGFLTMRNDRPARVRLAENIKRENPDFLAGKIFVFDRDYDRKREKLKRT
jgi:hypothetical protein